MNWMQQVLDSVGEVESPKIYIRWSCIAAVSAAIRRNVWVERGGMYQLFPNLYVLLVGKSALRKSMPINLMKDILEIANVTRIISGRNSIESILLQLGKKHPRKGAPPIVMAHGFLVASEFHHLFLESKDALTILTDLYDSMYRRKGDVWKNTLKKSGTDILKEPCLTLLGATTPIQLEKKIPDKDKEGGFLGRTIIVGATQKECRNPLFDNEGRSLDRDKLAERIKEIARLEGEMKLSPEAIAVFDAWDEINFKREQRESDDTGLARRGLDMGLRIATILSLMRDDELIITEADGLEAIHLISEAEQSAKAYSTSSVSSTMQQQLQELLRILIENPHHSIPKGMLLREHYRKFDMKNLGEAIELLEMAGLIFKKDNSKRPEQSIIGLTKMGMEKLIKRESELARVN